MSLPLFPAFAQEALTVLNAASQTGNGAAAPGSMLAIQLIPQVGEPFPTLDPTALNVTILPNGANYSEECQIVPASGNFAQFLNPLEVLAVLPSTLPLGPAQLSLYHSGLTVTAPVTIVASSLGLFPLGSGFTVQQVGSGQSQGPNQLTHPAQPGDMVTLWGTGLGSANQVTVLLGGVPVTASSEGPVPGMPGIDQIQFVVPDDPTIPDDCYVAVEAQTAGATSNTISISKTSDGSACQSTLGLTAADLATLDGGGMVGLAQLSVSGAVGRPLSRTQFLLASSASPGFARIESASFTALGENAAGVGAIAGTAVADEAFFGCMAAPPSPLTVELVGILGNAYDFGSQVTLEGSGGTLNLTSPVPGGILFDGEQTSPTVSDPSELAPQLFTPGNWTFSGKGGTGSQGSPAAAPFSVPLTLPSEIMATNFGALQTINRQQDLVVMWDPTGFGEHDVLTVTMNNAVQPVVSAYFIETGVPVTICKVPATNGQATIPAAMLQALTPSKTAGAPTASVNLSVSPRSGPTQIFSLPLTNGGTLHGVMQFTSSENWPVTVE